MEEVISTRDIKEILEIWSTFLEFQDNIYPDRVAKLKETKTVFKRSAGKIEQSMTEKAKTCDEK